MPRHTVDLPAFKMGRFPVTVAQVRGFAEEIGRQLDDDWERFNALSNHPVVMVSWYDATVYCEWLTRKLKERGRDGQVRLPKEAE